MSVCVCALCALCVCVCERTGAVWVGVQAMSPDIAYILL